MAAGTLFNQIETLRMHAPIFERLELAAREFYSLPDSTVTTRPAAVATKRTALQAEIAAMATQMAVMDALLAAALAVVAAESP